MITHPNEATADHIASITTWEEVESVPPLPLNQDEEKPAVMDGLGEVLILDMKVNFQNKNELILAAEEDDCRAPLHSNCIGVKDNIVAEGIRNHDSPRFSTDQTMMSAISELSLHASDVSVSGVEEMHISPFWKNTESEKMAAPEDLSSIHVNNGAESPLFTPLLEPRVPLLSTQNVEMKSTASNDAETEQGLLTSATKDTMDCKQEYDMDAFVNIANYLDDGQHLTTELSEQQGEHGANKHVVQKLQSSRMSEREMVATTLPSTKFRFRIIRSVVALLSLAGVIYPICVMIRYNVFARGEESIAHATVARNMSGTFFAFDRPLLASRPAWNMNNKPTNLLGSAIVEEPTCKGSNESSSWLRKLSLLVSLATLVLTHIRTQSRAASQSEIQTNNGMEANQDTNTASALTNHLPNRKSESVVFCHGNHTLTHVKVEVIHSTSPSDVTWADFDLSQYTKLRVVDLKTLLRERQCKVSGVKMELILRLVESYASELESKTVKGLREMLKGEGLKVSGRKKELIQRLVEIGFQ